MEFFLNNKNILELVSLQQCLCFIKIYGKSNNDEPFVCIKNLRLSNSNKIIFKHLF